MKATIETLTENRNQVIDILTSEFGSEKLRPAMVMLKNHVEEAEMMNSSDTLERVISNFIDSCPFRTNKSSKTADMIAEMAENRGEVWNSKEQKFVKL